MMRDILRFLAVGSTVCLVLSAIAPAGPGWAQAPTIQASNAWARRAAAMGSIEKTDAMGKTEKMDKMPGDKGTMSHMSEGATSAVYVTLNNSGAQADALVSASSAAARTVELHEVTNEGGVMKMRPVKSIPIAAGGKVELKPGGYHLMLLGLTHDLKPGEKVPVTLKFERGAEVQIDAAVR